VTVRLLAGIVRLFVVEMLLLLLVPLQLPTFQPLAGLAVSVMDSPA
jgi:hypothetical protein